MAFRGAGQGLRPRTFRGLLKHRLKCARELKNKFIAHSSSINGFKDDIPLLVIMMKWKKRMETIPCKNIID
jgi:hypothetical protein